MFVLKSLSALGVTFVSTLASNESLKCLELQTNEKQIGGKKNKVYFIKFQIISKTLQLASKNCIK
jgi:hypothetical protein